MVQLASIVAAIAAALVAGAPGVASHLTAPGGRHLLFFDASEYAAVVFLPLPF